MLRGKLWARRKGSGCQHQGVAGMRADHGGAGSQDRVGWRRVRGRHPCPRGGEPAMTP
jgi:hypothetical protein